MVDPLQTGSPKMQGLETLAITAAQETARTAVRELISASAKQSTHFPKEIPALVEFSAMAFRSSTHPSRLAPEIMTSTGIHRSISHSCCLARQTFTM